MGMPRENVPNILSWIPSAPTTMRRCLDTLKKPTGQKPLAEGSSESMFFASMLSKGQTVYCSIVWTKTCCSFMIPYMGVSKNRGFSPPNHPILIGFSIKNHPFWDTPIFGNTHIKPYIWFPSIIFLGAGQVMPVAHLLLTERQDDVVFVTMVAHVEDLRKRSGRKVALQCITTDLT